MRFPTSDVAITTRQALAILGISNGRLTHIKRLLPPLEKPAKQRGGGKLYSLYAVLAYRALHPVDRANQLRGARSHINRKADYVR